MDKKRLFLKRVLSVNGVIMLNSMMGASITLTTALAADGYLTKHLALLLDLVLIVGVIHLSFNMRKPMYKYHITPEAFAQFCLDEKYDPNDVYECLEKKYWIINSIKIDEIVDTYCRMLDAK